MPHIKLSAAGAPTSSVKKPGTYYSSAIALSKKARNDSIRVGIGAVEILRAADTSCLWTADLQSCFPVIFKFRNGDIGLLHGNSADISKVESLLNRDDLVEIELFEKGHQLNSKKVKAFTENVIKYFQNNKLPQPAINIQIQDHIASYGVVVCYKSLKNKPIILVGDSIKYINGLAHNLSACTNQEEVIHPYEFEDATERFSLIEDTFSTGGVLRFFEVKKNRGDDDMEIGIPQKKSRNCTIL
ncbi:hypothetical protein Lste_3407 [Legionella steelei]|uniref:Uncharacterized protein n=1 Tax=Legionella steelei TaxID=947033 RepID=A0A0W0ZDC6_9GAMM|nr:hypothetical protein [Legionella steelei]KTD67201.1 hypothetical protein Lste_3407 [Legionella steelei]